jgi:hypothetical protein
VKWVKCYNGNVWFMFYSPTKNFMHCEKTQYKREQLSLFQLFWPIPQYYSTTAIILLIILWNSRAHTLTTICHLENNSKGLAVSTNTCPGRRDRAHRTSFCVCVNYISFYKIYGTWWVLFRWKHSFPCASTRHGGLSIYVCLYIYLYINVPIYSSTYIYLSISTCLFICTYLYLSIYLYLSNLSTIHQSTHPYIFISIYLSVCLYDLSVCVSINISSLRYPLLFEIQKCISENAMDRFHNYWLYKQAL